MFLSRVNTADIQEDELYLTQLCNVLYGKKVAVWRSVCIKSPLFAHYMHDPLLCDSAGCPKSYPARRFFFL
jgi:hypothetical protein